MPPFAEHLLHLSLAVGSCVVRAVLRTWTSPMVSLWGLSVSLNGPIQQQSGPALSRHVHTVNESEPKFADSA